MREYKFFNLNPKIHLDRAKDIADAELELNNHIQEGWQLEQLLSPADLGGAIYAVMYKE